MSDNNGWIKLHRKILDNPVVMKDQDYFIVWMYLLLNASHKEYSVLFNNKRITLHPGQLITGRLKIAEVTKVESNKVYRILKTLKSEQQIEQQTCSQNSLITILNWDCYQNNEQQNAQRVNNGCTTSEHKQEYKNIKKIKNNNSFLGTRTYDFAELETKFIRN